MSTDNTTEDHVAMPGGSPDEPGDPSSWRSWLVRRTDDRIVAGVAAGLAAQLGVSAVYVRAAFVVLAFAGGFSLILYGLAWVLFPSDVDVEPPPPAEPIAGRQMVGLGVIFVAVLLALRSIGLWFGDVVVWPIALVTFGLAAIWDRGSYDYRSAFNQIAGPGDTDKPSRSRVIVGGALMFLGAILVLRELDAFRGLGTVALAVAVTVIGFVLVFGPFVYGLANDLAAERRDRIRADERAEVAAHLHDSVLQTLALIQRTDDPKKMVTLARAQERELRSWLYGVEVSADDRTLRARLESAAARVEQEHDIPVEVVVVGDMELDDRTTSLVQAASEAMTNAAKHSGADRVSVYAEVGVDAVDVWVSDLGIGFDRDLVDDERLGIKESIIGRITRKSGTVTIESDPGDGTEVHVRMEGLEL